MNLNQLFCEMIQYYRNDPKRIQHFTKVHSYAKLIGELSGMQGEELLTLEVAAYVHDIGIKVAEEKYGSSNGRLQEQEGPAVAEDMLHAYNKIFRTEHGKRICAEMFGIEE